ncbi:hypothetical protein IAD21_03836 [Abditibacteriota bacterium]|nr:hypothetical protein IAD21_03836 [Abditibacteriota bacterium]
MPTSVAEAKLTIKELKLEKKEHHTRKREIRASMASERATYRRVGEQTRTARSDYGFFNTFKNLRAASDYAIAREQKESSVALLEAQLRLVDNQINQIDKQILELERYVLENSK